MLTSELEMKEPEMKAKLESNLRRLLTWRQLKDLVGLPFSREHVWRLEAANKFPRRIYLSPQKVVWYEDEILAWLAERDAERAVRIYRTHE
jgi:prophage regulatory protein